MRGKASLISIMSLPRTDHPRLCGEKFPVNVLIYIQKGSPPPMRGKGHIRAIDTVVEGITPAYAGKRLNYVDVEIANEDHPRLCGEKSN